MQRRTCISDATQVVDDIGVWMICLLARLAQKETVNRNNNEWLEMVCKRDLTNW